MSNLIVVSSDEQFQNEVAAAGDRPVLVDFYAEWCGPCKGMAPALEAYAQANPQILVIKADVDTLQDTAAAHGVRSIPTLELVRHGKTLGKKIGAVNASQLTTFVDTTLAA